MKDKLEEMSTELEKLQVERNRYIDFVDDLQKKIETLRDNSLDKEYHPKRILNEARD